MCSVQSQNWNDRVTLICRIFVVFLPYDAIHNLGITQSFKFLLVNIESLGAPRRDLRGQNRGQIQNQHEKLYKISLSQPPRTCFKNLWYTLLCNASVCHFSNEKMLCAAVASIWTLFLRGGNARDFWTI